jgi:hypothetical protein
VRRKREWWEIDVSGVLLLRIERSGADGCIGSLVGYGDIRIDGRGEDSFVGRSLWKLLGTGVDSREERR